MEERGGAGRSGEVLFEESQRALVGICCGLLVVMGTAGAGEGVVAIWILMKGDMGVVFEPGDDLALGLRIDEFVLARDVEHKRCCDAFGFGQTCLDVDAVKADGGVGIGVAGSEIGQHAAEAIADCADLARGQGTQRVDAGFDVGDACFGIEFAEKLEGFFQFFFGLIGDVDARLDAPEEIGAEGDEALSSEIIGDIAHDFIDAENFLNDEDAWLWACAHVRGGGGEIARKAAVGAFDGDGFAAHEGSPRKR